MNWDHIQYQLDKRKWSIYKLTKEAGLSQNLLYEFKSGRSKDLSFSTVCKIADALGVSLEEFRKELNATDE